MLLTDPGEADVRFFEERLGAELVLAETDRVRLELVAAEPRRTGPDDDGTTAFVVTFHGPPAPVLEQATWTLRGDEIDMPLFVVPTGPTEDARAMCYDAVFTRLA